MRDERFHDPAAHKESAAEIQEARGPGTMPERTGEGMAVLSVNLMYRDALQATGILQPDYEVLERAEYYFVTEDGSVFNVQPEGCFARAQRVFVEGPRNGQTETLTNAQVEEYQKQAEDQWGKYIPGTLLREPKFIPGARRKSLPLIKYEFGVPREAGWIDEKGVRRYKVLMPEGE
jgi:hypothetical protein